MISPSRIARTSARRSAETGSLSTANVRYAEYSSIDLRLDQIVPEDLGHLLVGEHDPARRRLGHDHPGRQLRERLLEQEALGADALRRLAAHQRQLEVRAHAGQQLAP